MWLTSCSEQDISCTYLQWYNTKFRSVHSQHQKAQIVTRLTSNIHFKSVNLLINLVKYKKQYSPSLVAMISVTSRPQCQNFTLDAPTHTIPSIPIGCHAPTTDFPACSLVFVFSDSLGIYHDYLLFHIFAFINLKCFSSITITWYTN